MQERTFTHILSMEPQLFKETILKNFDFIEDLDPQNNHSSQTFRKLDDKKLQCQDAQFQKVKALDAISEDKAKKSCMIETYIGHNVLNVDSIRKALDKEEFQEIGSIASFKVLETQFQMFIKSRMYLDDEFVVMTRNYFLQYTQLAIPEFRDTLIQHMESVKKSIDERAQHKREYDTV
ncbi:hypothetical protein Tco_0689263 [Tanacetum coccineum]